MKILESGAALGFGNGPLLVCKEGTALEDMAHARIAIPGANTTANLLLSMAYPAVADKTEYLFSDIEHAVLSGEVDAGLLIHETRFTYHTRGLKKIADLGEWWEHETSLPLPLGVIVAKQSLPSEMLPQISKMLAASVAYAFDNPDEVMPFVKCHAREMADEVVRAHIALYVNKYTRQLGQEGKSAIRAFFARAAGSGKASLPELHFADI